MSDIDWISVAKAMFPHTPIEPISRNLPNVMKAIMAEWDNDPPPEFILVCLATIRAEVEGFEPIPEQESRYNTARGGAPFGLYEQRTDLGNAQSGDGELFRGRGFVQLTGRANYRRYSTPGCFDLVANPELACDPEIASTLLVRFVMDRWPQIFGAIINENWQAARREVNGGSHGLERFIDAYRRGVRLIDR